MGWQRQGDPPIASLTVSQDEFVRAVEFLGRMGKRGMALLQFDGEALVLKRGAVGRESSARLPAVGTLTGIAVVGVRELASKARYLSCPGDRLQLTFWASRVQVGEIIVPCHWKNED
jgi:hypothetical protein